MKIGEFIFEKTNDLNLKRKENFNLSNQLNMFYNNKKNTKVVQSFKCLKSEKSQNLKMVFTKQLFKI